MLNSIKSLFAYGCVRAVQGALWLLPYKGLVYLGRGLGGLCFLLLAKRRRVVMDNLQKTWIGQDLSELERRELTRSVFRRSGVTFCEVLCLNLFKRRWSSHVLYEQRTLQLLEQMASQRGVVVTLSHFGNWELMSLLVPRLSVKVVTVGQTIKNPYLHRWIVREREQQGLHVVDKKGFLKQGLRTLKDKGIVVLLADQNAGKHGVTMPFLGHEAKTFTTPALLALKSGAPLVHLYDCVDADREHRVVIEPGLDPQDYLERMSFEEALVAMTQDSLRSLEQRIEQQPENWFWLHKRWKA